MMTINDFKQSVTDGDFPASLPPYLQALWHDGRDNWKAAHDLIDHLTDQSSSHIHAYLHRKEGDVWNADYWYRRAGKKRPNLSLEEEWEQLIEEYLV